MKYGTVNELYDRFRKKLTVDHLKKISIDIITAYKNGNYRYLRKYIPVLNISPDVKKEKLFALLIRMYHPDRLSFITKQAVEFKNSGSYEKLHGLYESYFFKMEPAGSSQDYDSAFEAVYSFSKDDFGYRETSVFEDEPFMENAVDDAPEDSGFIEAVNKLFYGGLGRFITVSELRNLYGSLDLSDYDIRDLKGIEHCVYINELNLSNNRIEKIGGLSTLAELHSLYLSNNDIGSIDALDGLFKLRMLDVSFNAISDIRPLLVLDSLEYVNLLGNPVGDSNTIRELISKNVIVIYDELLLT